MVTEDMIYDELMEIAENAEAKFDADAEDTETSEQDYLTTAYDMIDSLEDAGFFNNVSSEAMAGGVEQLMQAGEERVMSALCAYWYVNFNEVLPGFNIEAEKESFPYLYER